MASFNGEKYIAEQINSIICQSYKNWRLTIYDDCSNDNTTNIIKNYVNKYRDRIHLSINQKPSGGAKFNFYKLLKDTKAEYVMCCDQDDVWLDDKVYITYEAMKNAEEKYGNATPILVHTDLKVVDDSLRVINESFYCNEDIDPRRNQFSFLLSNNVVAGCTVMVNKALIEHLKHIPLYSRMHDHWLGLIAAAFGKIVFIDKPTMLYRQHDNNVCGTGINTLSAKIVYFLTNFKNSRNKMKEYYRQAKEFYNIYNYRLDNDQKKLLLSYADFENKNIIQKCYALKRYRLYKQSFIQIIGQIIR